MSQRSSGTPRRQHPSAEVAELFRRFAHHASAQLGSPWAFAAACIVIAVWAITGPVFGFSDTWQLVINTGTTIVTFLMVFLIQNTQNRDTRAVNLKLDELIHAMSGARNRLIDLEKLSEDELDQLQEQFTALRSKAQRPRAPSRRRSRRAS